MVLSWIVIALHGIQMMPSMMSCNCWIKSWKNNNSTCNYIKYRILPNLYALLLAVYYGDCDWKSTVIKSSCLLFAGNWTWSFSIAMVTSVSGTWNGCAHLRWGQSNYLTMTSHPKHPTSQRVKVSYLLLELPKKRNLKKWHIWLESTLECCSCRVGCESKTSSNWIFPSLELRNKSKIPMRKTPKW